jgi:hypothetical protein
MGRTGKSQRAGCEMPVTAVGKHRSRHSWRSRQNGIISRECRAHAASLRAESLRQSTCPVASGTDRFRSSDLFRGLYLFGNKPNRNGGFGTCTPLPNRPCQRRRRPNWFARGQLIPRVRHRVRLEILGCVLVRSEPGKSAFAGWSLFFIDRCSVP